MSPNAGRSSGVIRSACGMPARTQTGPGSTSSRVCYFTSGGTGPSAPEGAAVDEGLVILAATQAAIVPIGLAVLWLASRRPRTAAVLIGVVLAAAAAAIWFGSN